MQRRSLGRKEETNPLQKGAKRNKNASSDSPVIRNYKHKVNYVKQNQALLKHQSYIYGGQAQARDINSIKRGKNGMYEKYNAYKVHKPYKPVGQSKKYRSNGSSYQSHLKRDMNKKDDMF